MISTAKDLGKLSIEQMTGNERLTFKGNETSAKLVDFWRWSVSDIISNATRGRLAEFIVAAALKIDLTKIRDEWSAYDLISPEGIKIEVKSASFLQSWAQNDFSKISFSIKAARFWDPSTGKYSIAPERNSDVYVFCLLRHKDKKTLNPLALEQWEFFVVSKIVINDYKRSNSSITLKSLQDITPSVDYSSLQQTIINSHKHPS